MGMHIYFINRCRYTFAYFSQTIILAINSIGFASKMPVRNPQFPFMQELPKTPLKGNTIWSSILKSLSGYSKFFS